MVVHYKVCAGYVVKILCKLFGGQSYFFRGLGASISEFDKGPFIKVVDKWVHGGPQYGPCGYVVKIQSAKKILDLKKFQNASQEGAT